MAFARSAVHTLLANPLADRHACTAADRDPHRSSSCGAHAGPDTGDAGHRDRACRTSYRHTDDGPHSSDLHATGRMGTLHGASR